MNTTYIEKVLEFHSKKVTIFENANRKFLNGIFQYQKMYEDLFNEKDYAKLLHYCLSNTSSVKEFFAMLEEQLIEHGAIRMRRKQEEKSKHQEEKEKQVASRFQSLEKNKEERLKQGDSQTIKTTETTSKWGEKFKELEARLRTEKEMEITTKTYSPSTYRQSTPIRKVSESEMEQKKLESLTLVVNSLYENGTYSLEKIAKVAGTDLHTVKRILRIEGSEQS